MDDASPDRCGEICDAYAREDCRVKVIHKKNGGAASARNAGLEAATGDYICFVDSDDVVDLEYVQYLYEKLQTEQADAAVCGFTILTKTANDRQAMEPCGIYSGNEYLSLFLQNWTCSLIWNKIYRRSVIGDIRFAEGHRIDDEFFTYRVIMNSARIAVYEDALYYYRQRRSSIMKADAFFREKMLLDKVAYMTERFSRISESNSELATAFLDNLLDSCVVIWNQCEGMPTVVDSIRAWIKRNWYRVLKSRIIWKKKAVYFQKLILSRPKSEKNRDVLLGNTEDYFA